MLPAGLIVLAGLAGAWAIALRHGSLLDGEGGGRTGEPVVDGGRTPLPPPPEPEAPFSFIFGGELRGRVEIPPCSRSRQGGLARISSVIQRMAEKAKSSVLLDTGDMPAAEGESGSVEQASILEIFREAGLAVSAVGEGDLLVGLDRWREAKNRRAEGIAVLCANLRDASGQALVPAVASFVLGTRRVHVAAVLSPSFEPALRAAGVDVRLRPPRGPVWGALRHPGPSDMSILISHAPVEESRELLKALPEVRLVVTAHAGERPWLEPEVVDGRLLMAPGTGWQYVSAAMFVGRPAGGIDTLDTHVRAVGEKAQASEPIFMRLRETMEALNRGGILERTLAERASHYSRAGAFTGPAACASCHPAAHAKWSAPGEPHARAFEPVVKMRLDGLPLCLECHVTAPGLPGGHLSPKDEQAAVTCEACHGNGAAHAANDGRTPLAVARDACIRCHTPEMDPTFSFDEKWPKVVHGR